MGAMSRAIEREITEKNDINEFLAACRVCSMIELAQLRFGTYQLPHMILKIALLIYQSTPLDELSISM